jgi:DNA/RNA-binding domain of Phe-tRNA-synthetase-like protein
MEGGNLPDINPIVNLYNAMSIKYLTPFGGEDLDTLYGDFELKIASGGERWIPIGGGKPKVAVKGELVWGDDLDLSTRALNWRQCDRTKMTNQSQNGYFVMDGFQDVNRENIAKAADNL